MAFDEDPNKIQKLQINETIRFIQEQEKIIKKIDKSIDFLYYIMTNYSPPDEDLRPFYDRLLVIHAMLKALIAEVKLYNGKNYTLYSELENFDQEETF